MKAAQINDLFGSYGTIQHENIWKAVARFGYTRLYLPIYQVNKASMDYIVDVKHCQRGIVIEPRWWATENRDEARMALVNKYNIVPSSDGLSAPQEALLMSSVIRDLGYDNLQCAAFFDDEWHGSPRIRSLLAAWRTVRKTRETGWSFEPFQGGWIDDNLVRIINDDRNLILYPQLYYGGMEPCSEGAVWKDLLVRKILWTKLRRTYGAISSIQTRAPYLLPDRWDGVDFTMELRAAT
jgi:hypothetical protein